MVLFNEIKNEILNKKNNDNKNKNKFKTIITIGSEKI